MALRYSDPFAIRWGPPALLLGPIAYLFYYYLVKRRSSDAASEPLSPH